MSNTTVHQKHPINSKPSPLIHQNRNNQVGFNNRESVPVIKDDPYDFRNLSSQMQNNVSFNNKPY